MKVNKKQRKKWRIYTDKYGQHSWEGYYIKLRKDGTVFPSCKGCSFALFVAYWDNGRCKDCRKYKDRKRYEKKRGKSK